MDVHHKERPTKIGLERGTSSNNITVGNTKHAIYIVEYNTMGSFAKHLGQIMRRSWESESSNILRTMSANKIENSLAKQLDETLTRGHDMKVFGLGTIASMASIDRYRYEKKTRISVCFV